MSEIPKIALRGVHKRFGKKVVLVSVPGAFTPTCSAKHLPSYVEKAGELKARGIDAYGVELDITDRKAYAAAADKVDIETLVHEEGGAVDETEIIGMLPDQLLWGAAADRMKLAPDTATRLLYLPRSEYPRVPAAPTRANVQDALQALKIAREAAQA